MHACELQLVHALPVGERQSFLSGHSGEKRFGDTSSRSGGAYFTQPCTECDETRTIESNPLAGIRTGFPGKPLQLFSPLVDGLRGLPTQARRPLF